jgi:hypothetical protein
MISRTACLDSTTSYLEGCVGSVRLDAVQTVACCPSKLYLSIFLYLFTVGFLVIFMIYIHNDLIERLSSAIPLACRYLSR